VTVSRYRYEHEKILGFGLFLLFSYKTFLKMTSDWVRFSPGLLPGEGFSGEQPHQS
jgi:hypothetical protein